MPDSQIGDPVLYRHLQTEGSKEQNHMKPGTKPGICSNCLSKGDGYVYMVCSFGLWEKKGKSRKNSTGLDFGSDIHRFMGGRIHQESRSLSIFMSPQRPLSFTRRIPASLDTWSPLCSAGHRVSLWSSSSGSYFFCNYCSIVLFAMWVSTGGFHTHPMTSFCSLQVSTP